MDEAVSLALLAFGYPVSIVVITRWVPVVRERRRRWFAWHQAAVAALVAGWLLRGRVGAALINATWLGVATLWYVAAGQPPGKRRGA